MSKKGESWGQGEMIPVDPSPGSGHRPQHLLQVSQVATPLHICIIANLFFIIAVVFLLASSAFIWTGISKENSHLLSRMRKI